jgi:hypothetical protein
MQFTFYENNKNNKTDLFKNRKRDSFFPSCSALEEANDTSEPSRLIKVRAVLASFPIQLPTV